MKKLKVLFCLLLLFLLTACGSADKEIVCTSSKTEGDIEYTAEYRIKPKDKKYAKSVTVIETIISTDDETKDYYQETVEKLYDEINKKYGGYKYEFDRTSEKLVATTTIDYDVMNLKQYIIDNPSASVISDSEYKATIDGIKNLYETYLDATCK